MKHRSILGAVAALTLTTLPAIATDFSSDSLEITGAFSRATPATAMAGVAFMTIRSKGEADKLVSYTTEACGRPELHTHIKDAEGVMRMRQVEAIEIPAGGEAVLQPGGLHLMCMQLNGPLVEGEEVTATLVFEKAGEVTLSWPIKAAGAMPMEHSH